MLECFDKWFAGASSGFQNRKTSKVLTFSNLRKTPVICLYDDKLHPDKLQTILASLKSQFIESCEPAKGKKQTLTYRNEKRHNRNTITDADMGQEGQTRHSRKRWRWRRREY